MEIYLVGGAVRDTLLGIQPKERDYVVVGASEKEMLALGYQKVGKDFPVFLHPTTHEEYALARTEQKTGLGYHGFTCHFTKETTLEEDLKRRDLTINALALDPSGKIIDPYGGQQDILAKCLRHVSDAFSQDPLRVLRVARFQARFPDFHIHSSTLLLLKCMVESADFPTLRKERVYIELKKALLCPAPWLFLTTLEDIGGLDLVYPYANTKKCQENMQKLLHLSSEHIFSGLLFHQTPQALCALAHLPLSRLEKYLVDKTPLIEAIDTLKTSLAWLTLFEKTDALRRREAFTILIETYDALCASSKMQHIYTIWSIMDKTIFPDTLKNAHHTVIKDYYREILRQAIEDTLLS